ncbi:hypothetical protein [Ancylobacter sp. FA202]|nr:hypothetical protein [Ancylobacter sp. FA202]
MTPATAAALDTLAISLFDRVHAFFIVDAAFRPVGVVTKAD